MKRFFTNSIKQLETHENEYYEDVKIYSSVVDNLNYIKQIMGTSNDLKFKEFYNAEKNFKMGICYIEGISDKQFIESNVLNNLMIFINRKIIDLKYNSSNGYYDEIIKNHLNSSQLVDVHNYNDLFQNLLSGNTILFIENLALGVSIGTKYIDDRAIDTPNTEHSTKGPKDCFIETIRTNTSLIRQRIKDVNLRLESFTIGKTTNTDVVIGYIKGIAPNRIVEKVKKRIKNIDIDALIDSTYIEKELKDQKYNIFPVTGHTERPDLLSIKLLEGRVAILVDGTPFVLFVPYFFKDNFKSVEEYYRNNTVTFFIKILRYTSFILTIFIAPIYVALTTFHHEMLPSALLLSFAQQYEKVPTPIIVEVIGMLFIFEVLKETSYKVPILTSIAILFVSGIVISQNMTEAGLVPPIVIIIIALTVVTNYIFRDEDIGGAIRIVRLITLLMSTIFGLLGIIFTIAVLVLYLSSITSLGLKYLVEDPFYNYKNPTEKISYKLGTTISKLREYINQNSEREGDV